MTPLPRTTAPELLHSLVSCLDDAGGPVDPAGRAALVRVRAPEPDDEASFELGLRHVDPDGPGAVTSLLGFDAPPDWEVLGLIAHGTAHPAEHPSVGAGDRQEGVDGERPVRIVHVVARSGACAWSVRLDGHAAQRGSAPGAQGAPEGRVDDVCRRALGLPTAAPPASTLALWATLWLDAVLIRALDTTGTPDSWAAVVRLHPAMAVGVLGGEPMARDATPALDGSARQLAQAKPWEQLRRDCALGRWSLPEMHPGAAGWMDDGMFAREVLGSRPSLPVLRTALRSRLARPLVDRVDAMLRAWGLC